MTNETLMMIDEKRIFLGKLEKTLRADPRTNLDCLEYRAYEISGTQYVDEHIRICFENGSEKLINTTGNSNIANMIAVGKAVM